MKEGTKLVFVSMLVFYFLLSLFQANIHLPSSPIYLFIVLLAGGLALLVTCPILNFLTIKCNFLTFLVMGTLLLTGVLYLMKMFMVDFAINDFVFEGLRSGSLEIKKFTAPPIVSIVLVSFLSSFLMSIYKELDRKQ
ncbi:hypothetical protein KBG23_02640 [Candidatus Dojkabacteria bacterium]|jgi:hypothetical protein|nr:hypothetical protein [Candidatus Dojkabacteria bacterium]